MTETIGMKEVKQKDYTVKGAKREHRANCVMQGEVQSMRCKVQQEEYKVQGEWVGEDKTC